MVSESQSEEVEAEPIQDETMEEWDQVLEPDAQDAPEPDLGTSPDQEEELGLGVAEPGPPDADASTPSPDKGESAGAPSGNNVSDQIAELHKKLLQAKKALTAKNFG